ncbi:hypothetical protein NQ317_014014 [Molorchus minor]|uniref:Uncharacterized protein n=1 Tax=Molorchus minor TaxID=1323400 RepID=A0ABQ9IVA0_9CUCU|nr:hypothetical protein NQ317_014014 [Molorchus minor]
MSSSSLCIACGLNCPASKNALVIFKKERDSEEELHIASLLSKVLDKEIEEDPEKTQVVCKKCDKLLQELHELQRRVSEIRNELIENHKNSIGKTEVDDDTEIKERTFYVLKEPIDKNSLQTMEDIEMELVKVHGGRNGEEEEHQERENAEMDVECDNIDADILDSGAVEHSSDSDYEPPISAVSEDPLVQAAVVAEKNIVESVKVKAEPEEPANAVLTTVTEKPNILKKKKPPLNANNSFQQQEEEKKVEDFFTMPIVAREGNLYTCLLCQGEETVAGEAKAITLHMKQGHGRNLLSAHLDEHVAAEDGDFQCEICNRIFSNLRLFRIHRRMHYPQNKAWVCNTCGKKYSSKNLLDEHVNTHLGVRPYVCGTCGKDFASKYTYKAHEKTHEVRPRPFCCTQCPKSFLSQQNLTQHERTHSGMKEFGCHLCGKQFSSAHNLEVHSIVHTGYKPFVCGLCGKAFARKAEIRDHERTHTGERPYQCEFCGATFSQRSNLQSHKRATHYDDKRPPILGERPFKCDVCEATFVYPEHFKKHRRIHTGEKPFLCEVCGKAFNSRDNRNAHRFVHSDKKPYECLVCGAGFMRKPLLYQHMQAQGHLNDTIVVNQPRLTTDDDQLVTVNSAGEMEIVDAATAAAADSKLYIQDQDGTEHIIIDGQQISFAEGSDEENDGEIIDEIEQVVTGQVDDEYEEIITSDVLAQGETQIIETPEGPVQLSKGAHPER